MKKGDFLNHSDTVVVVVFKLLFQIEQVGPFRKQIIRKSEVCRVRLTASSLCREPRAIIHCCNIMIQINSKWGIIEKLVSEQSLSVCSYRAYFANAEKNSLQFQLFARQ